MAIQLNISHSFSNNSAAAIRLEVHYKEICTLNSFHKTDSIREDCTFFMNIPKILSTCNVRLFLNILPHVQVSIFSNPCHGISSVSSIHHVVGSDTIKKFVGLTHLIKLIQ